MSGFVLWKGPSQIDGAPIVVIATEESRNVKTGPMVQTWILREDVSPLDAVNSGADASVCGSCIHRGSVVDGHNVGRSCYVTIFQAPRSIWECYKRGGYDIITSTEAMWRLKGKKVRLGAYGNPSAAPLTMWRKALRKAQAQTGYIHNWRDVAKGWRDLVMASCDSPADYVDAIAAGYRTFRVRRAGEPLAPREVSCPASEESGHKTTCAQCVACGGLSSKAKVNIAIVVHGARAGNFNLTGV